jgi:integrase
MPYKDQGKWRGVVKINGQRVAQRRFDTKREARNWEVEEGNRLKRVETGMDFETFANEYLDWFEERRGKNQTYQEKVRVAKRFIHFIGEDVLIDEVSTREMEEYLREQKKSRSANASNKDRKELLAMWNWGVKRRGLKSNPVTLTERFLHDEKPQYTPPEQDVLRVVAASSGVDRVFLECYLQTGARRSEIFKLKWEDVNFERGTITLYTRKSRDGSLKSRTLPMNKRLQDALWWWWHNRTFENEPWVFVDDHQGVHIGKPYKVRRLFLKSLCEKANVKPFGFHGLRRFVASVLSDKYIVSTPTIQNILGHEKPTTTDRYIKRIAGNVVRAMDMLAGGNEASGSGKKKAEYPESTPPDLSFGVPNRI